MWENRGTDFWELADRGIGFSESRSSFGKNNKEKVTEVRPETTAHVGLGENTLKTYDQKHAESPARVCVDEQRVPTSSVSAKRYTLSYKHAEN